jgi:putative flippase GtrA
MWHSLPKVLRYLVVGIFNTLVGYAVFAGCFLGLGEVVPYWVVLALSHFTAVSFSFLTQRYLVFGGAYHRLVTEFLVFQGSYLLLAPQGIAINWGLVHLLNYSPWLAQGIAMLFGIVTAFLLHRFLVFRKTG